MTPEDLLARARHLAEAGERRILGIAGAPGAGKSTLARWLVSQLGDLAVEVPMDGFHLSNDVLADLGLRDRKGAPDTFDVDGYLALLRRLRHQRDDVVYAPRFVREIEESIGSAIAVHRATPLAVTEGNYLLLAEGPWAQVRPLLDEAWFVHLDREIRIERLVARHMEFGRDADAARAWVMGSDELNADLVLSTASAADLLIDARSLDTGATDACAFAVFEG